MNDRDDRLKQAICQAPHPGLRSDFTDQTIARIANGKHTDQRETLAVQGDALLFGLFGSTTRRRWMIIAALAIAAALSVQAIQTMNAEDELLELDTLSMSSLLAL